MSSLKELAERLGVSTSTISRALNDHDVRRASTRARAERIRAMAAEIGYAPNSIARSLKTNHRRVVGLLLPDIMNDYYATAATLVQETLAGEGLRALLCVTHDDPSIEEAQLRMLREERVAGIVIVPSPRPGREGQRRGWQESGDATPVVELVRQSGAPATDAVLIDDVDAALQGARHLTALHHQRIAVLTGPPTLSTSRLRLTGYRQALEEAGLPVVPALIRGGPYRRETARQETLRLLDLPERERPTAIIATSNELVVGALQALTERGIGMPDDLSLVGFGNPAWFALLRPALTTMALPIGEMATTAVRLLLTRINSPRDHDGARTAGDAPAVVSRYQAQLLVRASTRQTAPIAHDN